MTNHEVPFSQDTEEYLLACCVMNDNAIDAAADIIEPEDFYWPQHEILYRKMLALHIEGKVVDTATLSAEGADTPLVAHLYSLPAITTRTSDYACQLRDMAVRRRIIKAGQTMIEFARENPDADEVLDLSEAALYAAKGRDRGDGPEAVSVALDAILGHLGQPTAGGRGLMTPIPDVNEIIVGLDGGTFNILAARPGQGKTCFALDIARHVSKEKKVVFFSVEMTKKEIAERLISSEATVGLTALRTGEMSEREVEAAQTAISSLRERKLIIDDSAATMFDVQRRVRRVAARGDLGLIIVDYIQLLNMGGKQRFHENRVNEVAQISRAMKLMSREYNVPVIGLSQLSRPERKYDGEKQKPMKPNLASLRESGALEQDADQVWFLYRPMEESNEVEFIVAKNRSGPVGKTALYFWPQNVTFTGVKGTVL